MSTITANLPLPRQVTFNVGDQYRAIAPNSAFSALSRTIVAIEGDYMYYTINSKLERSSDGKNSIARRTTISLFQANIADGYTWKI